MSHPYGGLRCCKECGAIANTNDMIEIPEEGDSYILCMACYEGIEDGWGELQKVIQEGI